MGIVAVVVVDGVGSCCVDSSLVRERMDCLVFAFCFLFRFCRPVCLDSLGSLWTGGCGGLMMNPLLRIWGAEYCLLVAVGYC